MSFCHLLAHKWTTSSPLQGTFASGLIAIKTCTVVCQKSDHFNTERHRKYFNKLLFYHSWIIVIAFLPVLIKTPGQTTDSGDFCSQAFNRNRETWSYHTCFSMFSSTSTSYVSVPACTLWSSDKLLTCLPEAQLKTRWDRGFSVRAVQWSAQGNQVIWFCALL